MKYFYIASFEGDTAIHSYSGDFYRLVLKEKGYIHIDSSESITTILSAISSKDTVYIELSIHLKKEIEILNRMLNANYQHIVVTMHDSPTVNIPFRIYNKTILNKVYQFLVTYLNNLNTALPYLRKIKLIFVLSKKNMLLIRKRYKLNNVFYLPHVIDPGDVKQTKEDRANLSLYAYPGNKKEIQYALSIHNAITKQRRNSKLYFIGGTHSDYPKQQAQNVFQIDYIPENKLHTKLTPEHFHLVLNSDVKTRWPQNGRHLFALKHGNIFFSEESKVAGYSDKKNYAFRITGNLASDVKEILNIMNTKGTSTPDSFNLQAYLIENHSPAVVTQYLIEI
jgi:hypothetical protein